MKLKIETGDLNHLLRTVSTPVEKHEIKQYLELGKTMLDWIKTKDNACGLAAPQVGVNKRIIAIYIFNEDMDRIRALLMINPRILEHSEETKSGEEGCFSVPDTYGEVERYCKIKVQFFDEKGDAQSLILKDFNARIVQHEIDHLDGILFTDKLEAN